MKAKCVSKYAEILHITVGKIYDVVSVSDNGAFFRIHNDKGTHGGWPSDWFEVVPDEPAKTLPQVHVLTLDIPQGAKQVVVRIADGGASSWQWDCVA